MCQERRDRVQHAPFLARRAVQFVADAIEPLVCAVREESKPALRLLVAEELAPCGVGLQQQDGAGNARQEQ